MKKTIIQLCPNLKTGGVERGVIDVAIFMKQANYESIVISHGGKLVSELEHHHIKHIKLPIHSKNPIVFLINLRRLKQLFTDLKPDLLLPYSRIPTWLVFFLRKKMKIPFISHCLGIHRMGKFGFKKIYNSVMMRGDYVIFNSAFTQSYFLDHYPNTIKKMAIVPRSVDLDYFNPQCVEQSQIQALRERWKVPSDKMLVLLAARFTAWKGHEVLIHALAKLKQIDRDHFYVVFVGDHHANETYVKRLNSTLNELDLKQNVFFAGDHSKMHEVYAAADIVVSTSTEPEAFGRTIIEAQAMGKIVVATQHGGALETINNNHNGLLVKPGDPAALANALSQLSKMNSIEKMNVVVEAQKSALNFSKEIMCARLHTVYNEFLGV